MKLFRNHEGRETIKRLRNVSVFHELTWRELLEVDELLHERTYEKDEVIFEEGDAGHGIYIILSGKVLVKSRCKVLEEMVPQFGPGDMLGELTLFDEAPRAGTAVAAERTQVAALFQAEFSSLLTRNKNIGAKVLFEISRIMSRRIRRLLHQEKGLPSV